MNAKQTLAVVEDLLAAAGHGEWDTAKSLLASDVVLRIAGVPATIGGKIEGREAVIDFLKAAPSRNEVRTTFGDDINVCTVSKFSGDSFPGSQFFKGGDKPFTTWQCSVYRVAGGEVAEITNYVNWADVYVQSGVIDVASLLA